MALKAGSTFVFTATGNFELPSSVIFAGEKQNEGFGMIEILTDAYAAFQFSDYDKDHENTPEVQAKDTETAEVHSDMSEAYQRSVTEKKILSLAVAAANTVSDSQLPNNSQIGRLSLMADNSLEKMFSEEQRKVEHYRWKDYENRIDSIKSEGAKEMAKTLIRKFNQTVADAFSGSDQSKLKCVIIYLHILRYRSKTIAAEKNRHKDGKKNGKEGEAE